MLKTIFAVAAVAAQDDPCACNMMTTEELGGPPASYYESIGVDTAIGSSCQKWDVDQPYCQEGGEYYGQEFCYMAKCFVSYECDSIAAVDEWEDIPGTEEYRGKYKAFYACDQRLLMMGEEKASLIYASALTLSIAAIAASI